MNPIANATTIPKFCVPVKYQGGLRTKKWRRTDHPFILIEIAVGYRDKIVPIDKILPRNGAKGGADLVDETDIFVAWPLRNQRRTGAVEGVELIRYVSLEAIAQRLNRTASVRGDGSKERYKH
jgi:hypothetical protein